MYNKGTVILSPFPFTDLSGDKVRPAVIVSTAKLGDDVIVAFITSQKEKTTNTTDLVIKEADTGFTKTGLKTTSTIRLGKLATLNKKVVLGEIGFLGQDLIKETDKKLKILFGL